MVGKHHQNPTHNIAEQLNLPQSKIKWFRCTFCADCRSEIRFAISAKRSEKQTHFEYKAFVVGRFIGADRQTTCNKKLIYPSVLRQFQDIREEKNIILYRKFQNVLSVRLVLFLCKGRWSAVVGVRVFTYRNSLFWIWSLILGTEVWQCYLHVVHLNIEKNNYIYVVSGVLVFTMSRKCVNSPNLFCYFCGIFTPTSDRKSITPIAT